MLRLRGWPIALWLPIGAIVVVLTALRPAPPVPDDPWLERTPYDVPFDDRAGWLVFMAGGGVDTTALAEFVTPEEFAGLVDGTMATVERVRFSSDSLSLNGILMRPPGPGPFPAVVYARGGNREFGRLLFLDVVRMYALARAGAVVLAPEYRGENGSEGSPELAGGDVDDLLAAVAALGAWADADTTRLGLMGLSRGGLVAAWALTRTDAFHAAILLAPDLDLEDTARRRPAMDSAIYALSLPDYGENRDAALRLASPLGAVGEMAPTPILIVHGADDTAVHPSVSLDFSSRLLDAGHPHRLVLFEEAGHDLTSHSAEVRALTTEWLSTRLPGIESPTPSPPSQGAQSPGRSNPDPSTSLQEQTP